MPVMRLPQLPRVFYAGQEASEARFGFAAEQRVIRQRILVARFLRVILIQLTAAFEQIRFLPAHVIAQGFNVAQGIGYQLLALHRGAGSGSFEHLPELESPVRDRLMVRVDT